MTSNATSPDEWEYVRTQKLLVSSIDEQIKLFVQARLPVFTAPTQIHEWQARASELRRRALNEVLLRGYPRELVARKPAVQWGERIWPHEAYSIRKLRYQIYPDYWIPALLYEPKELSTPAPIMLHPNGHHWGGKAVTYKQARCANLARAGVISLNFEFIGMGELQADMMHNNAAYLALSGLASPGLMMLAMFKGLDILLAHESADATRVGVTGLSGGGWQTIVCAALDERITLAVPVSGYMPIRDRMDDLNDIGDLEQAPADLTCVLDYSDMTAMLAPRPCLQILNEYDEIFRTDRTKRTIYDQILPTYEAFGAADNFEFYSSKDPGTHCYGADIRSRLYRFLNKHWQLHLPERDAHKDDEILAESRLNVGLPDEQTSVAAIAAESARRATMVHRKPTTAEELRILRQRLFQVVRLPEVEPLAARTFEPGAANFLHTIAGFSVPVTVLVPPAASQSVQLVLADDGRASGEFSDPLIRPISNVSSTITVFADIFGIGECKPDARLSMLLESTGERVLGVQVAQVLALTKWALACSGATTASAIGWWRMASFALLVAAALEPDLFDAIEVNGELTSLLQLQQWGERYETVMPFLTPGLLTVADIPQMRCLLGKVRYVQSLRHVKPGAV